MRVQLARLNMKTKLAFQITRNIVNLNLRKMAPVISTEDPDAVSSAIQILKSGGVIALPTDTVYGLACCATNVKAIDKLYEIKARNENKPVAICVGNEQDVQNWAQVSHLPKNLLNLMLPGPVTLVLKCAHKLDKSLNFNGKIGVRIPDYKFIRDICNGLKVPIALTSANLSGDPSSVTVDEFRSLWDKLGGVFDGGVLGVGDSNRGASTVIDLSEQGGYKIIRTGIAYQQSLKILNDFSLKELSYLSGFG